MKITRALPGVSSSNDADKSSQVADKCPAMAPVDGKTDGLRQAGEDDLANGALPWMHRGPTGGISRRRITPLGPVETIAVITAAKRSLIMSCGRR